MNRLEEILKEALYQAGKGLPDDHTIKAAPSRKDRSLRVAAVCVIGVALAALPIALLVAPDDPSRHEDAHLGQQPLAPTISEAIAECMAAKDISEVAPSRVLENPQLANEWRAAVTAVARQECESSVLTGDEFEDYFERHISPDEYAAVMVPCLVAQGIPASALPDGGVGFEDMSSDQVELQREALYQCRVQYPIHPRFNVPLDDDQLRRLYDYQVGELTRCLEAEGYTVTPPPTAEAFIASYRDPGLGVWHPYPIDDPRLEHEDEWYRLVSLCPQSLPAAVLYGEE